MDPVGLLLVPVALVWYAYQTLSLAINRDTWKQSLGRASSCLTVAAVFYAEPTIDRWGQSFEAWAERNYTATGIVCTICIVALVTYSARLIRIELDERRSEPEYLPVNLVAEPAPTNPSADPEAAGSNPHPPPYDWVKSEVTNWDNRPDWQLR